MKIKYLIVLFFILITGSFAVYCDNEEKLLLVNAETLNLREKPARDSAVIDKLFSNRLLKVLEETSVIEKIDNIESRWYKVKTLNDKTGYVFGGYLKEPVNLSPADNTSDAGGKNSEPVEKIEAGKIAKCSFVRRMGNDLIIRLNNGRGKIISDFIPGPKDNEIKVKHHYFYDYLKDINYIIIENTYWESWDYTLINLQNGEEAAAGSAGMIISPDKKNILVLTEFNKFFAGGGINIIDISGGKPLMKFEKKFEEADYYPVKGVWTSGSFIRVVCKYDTNKGSFLFDMLLKYENGNWMLTE